MGLYHTGQVCLSGHPVNSNADQYVELNSRFCGRCGAASITKCAACNAPIRGEYEVRGVVAVGFGWTPEGYCYNCGQPYPWTRDGIDAAAELIDEAPDISAEVKKKLKDSLPDLTKDTARSQVAVSRFKRFLAKGGSAVADGIQKIVISIATEAVKKGLGF